MAKETNVKKWALTLNGRRDLDYALWCARENARQLSQVIEKLAPPRDHYLSRLQMHTDAFSALMSQHMRQLSGLDSDAPV